MRPLNSAGSANPELDQQSRAEVYGAAALRVGVKMARPISRGAIVEAGRSRLSAGRALAAGAGDRDPGGNRRRQRRHFVSGRSGRRDPDADIQKRPAADAPLGQRDRRREFARAGDRCARREADRPATAFGRTVTLEVTPEQAEKINVAAELGKLSLTLRSVTAADGLIASLAAGSPERPAIKPIWAGDVSPALGDAAAEKTIIVEQPIVEVIHGSKNRPVKLQ